MKIIWTRPSAAQAQFTAQCDGLPLALRGHSLLGARAWRVDDKATAPLPIEYVQQVLKSKDGLEGTVTVRNSSRKTCDVYVEFNSAANASAAVGMTRATLPLGFHGTMVHAALTEFGTDHLADGEVFLGAAGQNKGGLVVHYREPAGVDPTEITTKGLLLVPCVTWWQPDCRPRLSLFASPEHPWRFAWSGPSNGIPTWTMRTRITLAPGAETKVSAWLLIHEGLADVAWRRLHDLAHVDDHPRIDWLDNVQTHYFDFLSPGGDDPKRGGGYERALPHFRDFRVGLATQHGYYSHWGDYLQPDRKSWLAMRGDTGGPVEMSLDIMRARIAATRKAGAKAGVYLHMAGFDEASPLARKLLSGARRQRNGELVPFPWTGPDMEGASRFMSISSPVWKKHLLQQAQWVFELLDADAIVLDETFAGIGYDWHSSRPGPVSADMIDFMKKIRAIARSFGPDKAILTSDCGFSNFVMWADGEGGDHAYATTLGHETYRRLPVPCMATLGTKPWLSCAWQFNGFWPEQVDLARKTGAGLGVANGWIEYTGLDLLPAARRRQMLKDIRSLARGRGL